MIAGGGTGGHIFPALALAEAFRARDPKMEILFIGTAKGLEQKLVPERGYPIKLIPVKRLKGEYWTDRIRTVTGIPKALFGSARLIKGFQPDLVVGVGGYSSGPVVLMAKLMGKKTVLQEQNSVAGITNRILGRFADRVFTHFPESNRFFKKPVFCLGNPVRPDFLEQFAKTEKRGLLFTVLVVGGSQGAKRLNEAVTGALRPDFRDRIRFIHQTGENDFRSVAEAYHQGGFKAEVFPFSNKMGEYFKEADLVIARAGAMTITELAVSGRPSILVPYPFAADNHQQKNAEYLVQAGAARLLPNDQATGEKIAEIFDEFLKDRALLKTMGEKAKNLGRPLAAQQIVENCWEWIRHV